MGLIERWHSRRFYKRLMTGKTARLPRHLDPTQAVGRVIGLSEGLQTRIITNPFRRLVRVEHVKGGKWDS
jgi:hypothetical protein